MEGSVQCVRCRQHITDGVRLKMCTHWLCFECYAKDIGTGNTRRGSGRHTCLACGRGPDLHAENPGCTQHDGVQGCMSDNHEC